MKPPTSLEVDVDFRLFDLWDITTTSKLFEGLGGDYDRKRDLGLLIRGAYMMGYRDANIEVDDGRPGELYRANNMRVA